MGTLKEKTKTPNGKHTHTHGKHQNHILTKTLDPPQRVRFDWSGFCVKNQVADTQTTGGLLWGKRLKEVRKTTRWVKREWVPWKNISFDNSENLTRKLGAHYWYTSLCENSVRHDSNCQVWNHSQHVHKKYQTVLDLDETDKTCQHSPPEWLSMSVSLSLMKQPIVPQKRRCFSDRKVWTKSQGLRYATWYDCKRV